MIVRTLQLGRGAIELDRAVLEEDHAIEPVHEREVVRDHNERAAVARVEERLEQFGFGFGVERRKGLVHDDDLGTRGERAGEGDAVGFTAGEAGSRLADDRVEAIGEGVVPIAQPDLFQDVQELVVGCIGPREGQVVAQRLVEDVGLLREVSDGA